MARGKVERVAIFIDGSNLYFKLREALGRDYKGLSFDYGGLTTKLAGQRSIVYQGYYVGAVRADRTDKKAQELRSNQQKLFSYLKREGFDVVLGYLMKNDDVYHEKGVDVRLAVDMVIKAYEKEFDTAIVVSSDTDLVPAIRKMLDLGRRVEYVGFAVRPSLGMQKYADMNRLLTPEDLQLLLAKRQPKKLNIKRFDEI